MMENSPLQPLPKVSTEAIIDTLRLMRDKHLEELIRFDDALMKLLNKQYNTVALSPVKKEFMRRDLVELKRSSLDLVHYSLLIQEIKKRGGTELAGAQEAFIQELDEIFRKYTQ